MTAGGGGGPCGGGRGKGERAGGGGRGGAEAAVKINYVQPLSMNVAVVVCFKQPA